MRTIYTWNPQSFVIAVAQKFVLHEKFRATKRNETSMQTNQTTTANARKPQSTVKFINTYVWIVCCAVYRVFIVSFRHSKKSKTKHEQRQPK